MGDLHYALAEALGPLYRVQREVRPVGDRRLFVVTQITGGPDLLVKVLPGPLSLALDEAMLEREVLLLAERLKHPNLVAPVGAGRAGTHVFYSRPFVEGTTLRAWIDRNGELLLARAVEILRDVLAGLRHVHAANIAHGELRAENVLLSGSSGSASPERGNGRAVVCDAGIADALLRSHSAKAASPNVTRASDPRDDMYAVGALVHEMLTGAPPEPDGEPLAKRRSLPDWLVRLLDRCFADSARRWTSAGQALEALGPRGNSSGSIP